MPLLSNCSGMEPNMKVIFIINLLISVIFTICYAYQFFYLVVALFKKQKKFVAKTEHKYAFVIPARDESIVVGELVLSALAQNYPSEKIGVYVIADNCTDNTAEAARKAGATVYERNDNLKVGKGFALDWFFETASDKLNEEDYDGFIILDADNVLDKDYLFEMNKVFDNGYDIVTSYRNSKNYGTNWVSAGNALYFLRDAKYMNYPRMLLNTPCAVTGTGFLISKKIVETEGGWRCHLLSEDTEFTVSEVLKGVKIGYANDAVFYDEQPLRFTDSWNQRLRWTKGFYQVFYEYGSQLLKRFFTTASFTCYDVLITLTPGFVFLASVLLIGVITAINSAMVMSVYFAQILHTFLLACATSYLLFFLLGMSTTLAEWKRIYCPNRKKILYMFTFPIFMFTYVPLSVIALFVKIKWKPILHAVSINAEQVKN